MNIGGRKRWVVGKLKEAPKLVTKGPNMTSTCCREKAVLVAIYVEQPQRNLPLSKNAQGVHHHRYHHLHNVSENEGRTRGYNRKAELLNYVRYLRASVQTDASASIHSSQHSSHTTQSPTIQVVATNREPNHVNSPACFGKWDIFKLNSLNSTPLRVTKSKGKNKGKNSPSTTKRMKGIMKRFQVLKYGSFLTELLKTVHKCH